MKGSISEALRAHVVLLSISSAIAMVPCFGIALLPEQFGGGTFEPSYRAGVVVLAALVMLWLHWCARRAFRSALQARKIRLTPTGPFAALIARDCPRAWLVQLHLELRGLRCGE
ncbi:hypothetical protein [Burkholderia sp. Z1]|uniref:hypothetical protein n=1 Tax=Burkholderia sp. Z1 TaxID=2759039 RepID=UPI001868B6C9|nr:hypothetical protein [Burkholderia sp. Z1]